MLELDLIRLASAAISQINKEERSMSNRKKFITAVKLNTKLTDLRRREVAVRVYAAVDPSWPEAGDIQPIPPVLNDEGLSPSLPRAEVARRRLDRERERESSALTRLEFHLSKQGRMNRALAMAICKVCELPSSTWDFDYDSGRFSAAVRATYEAGGLLFGRPQWAGALNDLEIVGRNVEISIQTLRRAELAIGRPGQESTITSLRSGELVSIGIQAPEFEGPVRFALFDVDTVGRFTLLAPSDYSAGSSREANAIQIPPLRESDQVQSADPVGFEILAEIGIAHLVAVVCSQTADIALPEAGPPGSFGVLPRQEVDRLSAAVRKLNDPNLFGIGVKRYQVLP